MADYTIVVMGEALSRAIECPGQPKPIAEALWWHRQYEDNVAHTWLRRLIGQTTRRL